MELTLAVTGASGTIYAHRTLQLLAASGTVETINLIMSGTSATVAQVETGANLRELNAEKINEWIGLPCSMGTLGAIASGAGTNLIHRAADVTLKENRKLVLVPRETPYNQIHLENMLKLSRAGAQIMPASPGFYHRPKTIEELIDHLCFRILDQFDIPHSRKTQWTGEEISHEKQ
jgi:4-hydroxy-3-polyprenylbenzoate decarboxylase